MSKRFVSVPPLPDSMVPTTVPLTPRVPMTAGPLVAGVGVLLLAGVAAGDGYVVGVLPGIMVFGVGLALIVAPLTAAVLAAAPADTTGIASAVNNAAARLAGLVAVAAVPLAAGIGGLDELGGAAFAAGYRRAMLVCVGLCAAGAVVAWTTIRTRAVVAPTVHPSPSHGCAQRRALAGR